MTASQLWFFINIYICWQATSNDIVTDSVLFSSLMFCKYLQLVQNPAMDQIGPHMSGSSSSLCGGVEVLGFLFSNEDFSWERTLSFSVSEPKGIRSKITLLGAKYNKECWNWKKQESNCWNFTVVYHETGDRFIPNWHNIIRSVTQCVIFSVFPDIRKRFVISFHNISLFL